MAHHNFKDLAYSHKFDAPSCRRFVDGRKAKLREDLEIHEFCPVGTQQEGPGEDFLPGVG